MRPVFPLVRQETDFTTRWPQRGISGFEGKGPGTASGPLPQPPPGWAAELPAPQKRRAFPSQAFFERLSRVPGLLPEPYPAIRSPKSNPARR